MILAAIFIFVDFSIPSKPGLEGIEKSTNINIAAKIMEYIENSVKPKCPINPQTRKLKKDKIGAYK